MQQDVAGFDVAVHDVGLGQDLEGLQQILEVTESLGLLELAMQFDFLFQGASVTELVDEVVVVGCLEDLDEANDMGGVLYLGESLYFVDGELLEFGTAPELLQFDYFDCDCLVGLLVDGPVDLTELALPDDVVQHVVLYLFAHCRLIPIKIVIVCICA